jgi:hypothetical protein
MCVGTRSALSAHGLTEEIEPEQVYPNGPELIGHSVDRILRLRRDQIESSTAPRKCTHFVNSVKTDIALGSLTKLGLVDPS